MRRLLPIFLLTSTSTIAMAGCVNDTACLRKQYSSSPSSWPAPFIPAGLPWQELAPLPTAQSASSAKVLLGKTLFNDAMLSKAGDIACSSCHIPEQGFTDGLRVSPGHKQRTGRRNTPTVVSSSLLAKLSWDGSSDSLEQQALIPISTPHEMAASLPRVLTRLNQDADYQRQFFTVFTQSPITSSQLAAAMAAFQRSLLPVGRPLDRFLLGEQAALSDQQIQGMHLFRTKGRCLTCHQGAALSDSRFHNMGLTYYGRKYEDLGRYELTGDSADVGAFRTPSLRLVTQTGPWMHNGLFPTLRGVLNMYNAGMPQPTPTLEQQGDPLFPSTSELLQPLGLSDDELAALEAFLSSL